ncbi:Uncharacterized conserved protein [Edwardsiella tarda]|nr:Uncharacterized conserved protein [Edwardsiella tarda]
MYQLVKKFFPAAVPYTFNIASKRALVLKMLQVIRAGRWEYDRGERALTNAFNSVRKIKTPAGSLPMTPTAPAASAMAIWPGQPCWRLSMSRWGKSRAVMKVLQWSFEGNEEKTE